MSRPTLLDLARRCRSAAWTLDAIRGDPKASDHTTAELEPDATRRKADLTAPKQLADAVENRIRQLLRDEMWGEKQERVKALAEAEKEIGKGLTERQAYVLIGKLGSRIHGLQKPFRE